MHKMPQSGAEATMNDKASPHDASKTVTDKFQAPSSAEILGGLIQALPDVARHHARGTNVYNAFEKTARQAIVSLFGPGQDDAVPFGPFGPLKFPYRSMGAVDSLDLFGLDELIIFSFYWSNRERYRKVADIGANIGLHSLMMSRCGFDVLSFEPDPRHIDIMRTNLAANSAQSVEVVPSAVSDKVGAAEFIRVVGNTTGSHLAGAKENPYGELEKFSVSLVPFGEIIDKVDFAKIDAEGHEVVILTSIRPEQWDGTDVMLEIGTPENAQLIFDYTRGSGVNIFTQKNGWALAKTVADLPTSYKQGSAFLTRLAVMPGMSAE
jgi:FkbM family methyltransferase